MQEHKWWSYAVERRKSFCLVKNTAVSLSSAEAEFHALKTGIFEGMVTKHLLNELGYEATLVNHLDNQSAKASALKRGLGRMKHVILMYLFVQDVVEKKQTILTLCKHEFEQGRLDDKVSYF